MTFQQSVRTCFGKYVKFSGRASRSEYWWFVLAIVIGSIIFAAIDGAIFGVATPGERASQPFSLIFRLLIFLPILAAGFRRLQDTGRSGWYLMIPVLISFLMMFFIFGGIMGVSMMENAGVSDDVLRKPAFAIGAVGMVTAGAAQFIVALLLLWWLTRPSEAGINAYGQNPNNHVS